jgi:hypothetical protein
MPGQPVMPGFGRDGRTFHILMKSGNYLTWKIDEESMRAEACRLNPEACAANGYRKQLKPSSAK